MFATSLKNHRKEQQIFLITTRDKDFSALSKEDDKSRPKLMKFNDADAAFACLIALSNNSNHRFDLPSFVILDSRRIEKEIVAIISKLKSDVRFCMIPLVLMISNENQEKANQYYAAGASSCLPIPNDPEKFSALLELTRDYWLRIVTLPTSNNIY